MAEGLLRALGGSTYDVFSAGTIRSAVRPEAIAVMREIGIDISGHHSKAVDQFVGMPFDEVITVCDNAAESCPFFPGARHQRHWSIPDPAEVDGSDTERMAAFRRARDDLKARIGRELLAE